MTGTEAGTEQCKTDYGHPVVRAFIGHDHARHVIAKHPDGSYTVGYFYDPASGVWKFGTYGFGTMDDAADHIRRSRWVREVSVSPIAGAVPELTSEQTEALESYAEMLDGFMKTLNAAINSQWMRIAEEALGPWSNAGICGSVVSLRNKVQRALDGKVIE